MLFNSLGFALFLPIVFILYWFVANRNLKFQNVLLLASSYFFYACWDWRFLFLLLFSTLLDYLSGLKIEKAKNKNHKKFWFYLSIIINLGFLGFFKYFNFFAESFGELLSQFGLQVNPWTLKVILPVGISFYTFHGLSYVIDIYKGRIKAERSFLIYGVFVSFFPLLVAGPIERATHLLPQIQKKRTFDHDHAVDGLRQILWGLFKKIVIADQCAIYANEVFNNSEMYSGSALLLGAVFFAFQIYCDFSGYSDIAIGTAKLFGIDLLRNFAYPYFSRDIAEFWRRWHISLSTWFRDYLYIPLGGSKGNVVTKVRNTFIIFIISGFWHGANWTFIAWGALNAIYFIPLLLLDKNRNNLDIIAAGKYLPGIKDFFKMILTFMLVVLAWIFFRADDLPHAFQYISTIFSNSLFKDPLLIPTTVKVFVPIFLIVEWLGREHQFGISNMRNIRPGVIRWSIYLIILAVIYVYSGNSQEFIYFQF
ncbi:MAG: MBOAT family protein [Bacteroidetes bacterium]|nr:MBOAT family protein [Bacteroidota bacterium]